MENELTVVEWLINEIRIHVSRSHKLDELQKQAKEMEKKQLSKAYYRGVRDEWEGLGKDFEDFYTEKYGKAQ